MACFVPSEATEHYLTVAELIGSLIEQDVVASAPGVYHTHRRTAELDIYFLFNTRAERRALEFALRVDGQPELWDTFSGEARPLHRFAPRPVAGQAAGQDSAGVAEYDVSAVRKGWETHAHGRTRIRLTMEPHQGSLVVFSRGAGERPAVLGDNLAEVTGTVAVGDGLEVEGWCERAGRKLIRAGFGGRRFAGETRVAAPPDSIPLEGDWECRLQPTMDNRWGDFRYPAAPELIGAEARRFKYLPEGDTPGTELGWSATECADASWPKFTFSHGPFWWASAALTEGTAQGSAEGREPGAALLADALAGRLDPAHWSWHSYSELHGSADPDVHNSSAQGLQGVSENFLVFPATGGSAGDSASGSRDAVRCLCTNLHSARDQELTFNFGGRQPFPRAAWVNGDQVLAVDAAAATRPCATHRTPRRWRVRLHPTHDRPGAPEACELEQEAAVRVTVRAGWNRVVLRLTQPRGRKLATYAVFHDPAQLPRAERYVPLLKWFRHPPGIHYDIHPEGAPRVGWYRFEAPPGTRAIKLPLKARRASAWVDGTAVAADRRHRHPGRPAGKRVAGSAAGGARARLLRRRRVREPGHLHLRGGRHLPRRLARPRPGELLGRRGVPQADAGAGRFARRQGAARPGPGARHRHAAGQRRRGRQPAGRPLHLRRLRPAARGENSIEVTVHNTLANHYSIGYPTNFVYDGHTVSGLFGPVTLRFQRAVRMLLEPERRPDG